MDLTISPKTREKLKTKHGVAVNEVEECFENREGPDLFDTREKHASDPPTRWFVAETNRRRRLKVVYILKDESTVIRSAFDANDEEVRIYRKFAVGGA